MKLVFNFIIILFVIKISYSQTGFDDFSYLNNYFNHTKNLEFETASKFLDKKTYKYSNSLEILTNLIKDNGQSFFKDLPNSVKSFKLESSKEPTENAINNTIYAIILNRYKNKRVESFIFYLKAKDFALKSGSKPLIKYTLISLLNFYRQGVINKDDSFFPYLNLFKSYCENSSDFFLYYTNKYNLSVQKEIYDEKKSNNSNLYFLKIYDSLKKNTIFNTPPSA